jgi:prefoldin alpha subunit
MKEEEKVILPAKVELYEKFLNEQLKSDLKQVLNEREKLYGEIAEFIQVKTTIDNLLDKQEKSNEMVELKTKIDLGCNFYVNAEIPDTSNIFISIGYGFYLEMTLKEALKFIEKKIKFLNDIIDELTQQANKIKANIRIVLEGLKEIQNLNYEQSEGSKTS